MRLVRLAVAAVLVMSVVVMSACAGTTGSDETRSSVGAPYFEGETAAESAPQEYGALDQDNAVPGAAPLSKDAYVGAGGDGAEAERGEPMVIRTASVELRVKDVEDSLSELRATVRGRGAEITDLSVSGGDRGVVPLEGSGSFGEPRYASVVIRVKADKLSDLVEAVGELGTVVSQSESASDVTEQAIDMEARLRNLRAEETRLRSFLDRTEKVSELLQVEAELSRVRGEIEAMDAQLTYLKRQVARATLTVSLSEPGSVAGPDSPWYRLREAFARGVQGAIGVVEMLVTVVVASLPLLIAVGIVVWLIVRSLRRSRRRQHASAPGARDETDEPEDYEEA